LVHKAQLLLVHSAGRREHIHVGLSSASLYMDSRLITTVLSD